MLKLPEYITSFMKIFEEKGYKIYLVGGIVRDLTLGKQVDWNLADFATSARPQEIVKMFTKTFYENQFGTVGIEYEDGNTKFIFEVTTFRKESEYKDQRHPTYIEWAKTIEEDLGRRDFTINAMSFDGTKIIDPYNGSADLKNKLVRAVGDPNIRFSEDALRLLRAIRFSSQLGFTIEEKTLSSLTSNAKLIEKISGERIRDELLKIVSSQNPEMGILNLKETGIMQIILPELFECFGVSQISPKRHHIYDVGTHLVKSLVNCPSQDPITRLATLFHDIGKAKVYKKDPKTQIITFYNHEVVGARIVEKIANRLKLSNLDKRKLVTLVRQHQFTVSEEPSDKAIRRFIRNVGKDLIPDMLDLRTGDRLGGGATKTSWRLELFKKRLDEVQKQPFSISDLKINGEDVMKAKKIKPGKKVGEILNNLFEEVVAGKLKNERKELISHLSSN